MNRAVLRSKLSQPDPLAAPRLPLNFRNLAISFNIVTDSIEREL